jgi:hypothetical protein
MQPGEAKGHRRINESNLFALVEIISGLCGFSGHGRNKHSANKQANGMSEEPHSHRASP